MPPQKKSKKNTPAEANQEDHHVEEDNGNFLTAEPSQFSDQERSAKLEALSHLIFRRKPNASHMCARIKFTHI
jgi:hypothetical protein